MHAHRLYLLAIITCLASLASVAATKPAGWTADPTVVEQMQQRRKDRNYREAKVPAYTLPDALIAADGSHITTPREWQGRRAEIVELYRREMFGRSPARP